MAKITLYTHTSVTSYRGGPVPAPLQAVLLFFCLAGNFLEEFLFRGYFQGYLQTVYELKQLSTHPFKRIFLSGMLFGFMHSFLATTVTNEGVAVILFTLFEGLIAAFIREKAGLLSSTLAHGLAIYLLSAGLF